MNRFWQTLREPGSLMVQCCANQSKHLWTVSDVKLQCDRECSEEWIRTKSVHLENDKLTKDRNRISKLLIWHKMSPLSNSINNNNSNNININSSTLSSSSTNTISSSAFKPLTSENHRQLNMLTSSSGGVVSAGPMSSVGDHYSNDLTSPYGGPYHHHHHHHLNSQLSTQDYLNVHHHQAPLPPPLGVYKSEHDDLQGYSFARPVKLYDHVAPSAPAMDNGNTLTTSSSSSSSALLSANGSANGNGATNGYAGNLNGFRSSDAPSPGASIIDLSTSSVTSLRSGAGGNASTGFTNGSYYDGQRYDRSPQSASSPHYSSPQMLSPQGQTLDLSVGRTKWVEFGSFSFHCHWTHHFRDPGRLFDGYARASSVYIFTVSPIHWIPFRDSFSQFHQQQARGGTWMHVWCLIQFPDIKQSNL